MISELKHCPFCGGQAKLYHGTYTKCVICLGCAIMGLYLVNDDELIKAWNARAITQREALKSAEEWAKQFYEGEAAGKRCEGYPSIIQFIQAIQQNALASQTSD